MTITPVPEPFEPSVVMRAIGVLKREPVLFVTLGYVLLSIVGMWANYWYYSGFGIPVLEYMQAGDFLVAGLRDPIYPLALIGAVLFAWVLSWPVRWRERNPGRAAALRCHWWGRVILNDGRFFGMSRETALAFSMFWLAIWMLFALVIDKANAVREGAGHIVRVTLAGQSASMDGTARLLGTSNAFVFLYWPERRLAEAVPIEAIARLQSVSVAKHKPSPSPSTAPAPASKK